MAQNKGFRLHVSEPPFTRLNSIILPFEASYYCDLLRDICNGVEEEGNQIPPDTPPSNANENNSGDDLFGGTEGQPAIDVDLSHLALSPLALQFVASTLAALLLSKDMGWAIERGYQWHSSLSKAEIPAGLGDEGLCVKALLCAAVALDFLGCSDGSELIGDYLIDDVCSVSPLTMCKWFDQPLAMVRAGEVDAIHRALLEASAI